MNVGGQLSGQSLPPVSLTPTAGTQALPPGVKQIQEGIMTLNNGRSYQILVGGERPSDAEILRLVTSLLQSPDMQRTFEELGDNKLTLEQESPPPASASPSGLATPATQTHFRATIYNSSNQSVENKQFAFNEQITSVFLQTLTIIKSKQTQLPSQFSAPPHTARETATATAHFATPLMQQPPTLGFQPVVSASASQPAAAASAVQPAAASLPPSAASVAQPASASLPAPVSASPLAQSPAALGLGHVVTGLSVSVGPGAGVPVGSQAVGAGASAGAGSSAGASSATVTAATPKKTPAKTNEYQMTFKKNVDREQFKQLLAKFLGNKYTFEENDGHFTITKDGELMTKSELLEAVKSEIDQCKAYIQKMGNTFANSLSRRKSEGILSEIKKLHSILDKTETRKINQEKFEIDHQSNQALLGGIKKVLDPEETGHLQIQQSRPGLFSSNSSFSITTDRGGKGAEPLSLADLRQATADTIKDLRAELASASDDKKVSIQGKIDEAVKLLELLINAKNKGDPKDPAFKLTKRATPDQVAHFKKDIQDILGNDFIVSVTGLTVKVFSNDGKPLTLSELRNLVSAKASEIETARKSIKKELERFEAERNVLQAKADPPETEIEELIKKIDLRNKKLEELIVQQGNADNLKGPLNTASDPKTPAVKDTAARTAATSRIGMPSVQALHAGAGVASLAGHGFSLFF